MDSEEMLCAAVLFFVFIILPLAGLIVTLLRKLRAYLSNSRQPLTTQRAQVVFKRTDRDNSERAYAWYATFQMREDRTCQEFNFSQHDFDRLTEGDEGILAVQGSAFKGFRIQSVRVKR